MWRFSVRGVFKHSIVGLRSYLDVHNNIVIFKAPLTVIISLKVPGHLVKSERVVKIMAFIHSVESLGSCSVTIFLRIVHLSIVIIVEFEFSTLRAVTIETFLLHLGISVRDGIIASSCSEIVTTVRHPGE